MTTSLLFDALDHYFRTKILMSIASHTSTQNTRVTEPSSFCSRGFAQQGWIDRCLAEHLTPLQSLQKLKMNCNQMIQASAKGPCSCWAIPLQRMRCRSQKVSAIEGKDFAPRFRRLALESGTRLSVPKTVPVRTTAAPMSVRRWKECLAVFWFYLTVVAPYVHCWAPGDSVQGAHVVSSGVFISGVRSYTYLSDQTIVKV
jgi:hypothetical protein